jgi:adhesin/invasin
MVVNPSSTDLILSSASLSFVLTAMASGLPAPQNVTVRSSNVQQLLNYSVSTVPAVTWLDVTGVGTMTNSSTMTNSTGGSGITPGSITFTLDPSATALTASTAPLTALVVVTCIAPSPCGGNAQTIHVSLSVSAPAPQLVFTSSLIQFSTTASNTAALSQPVGLQNIGAGSAAISSITAAASWLTVTGIPAAVAGGPAVSLTFNANPTGLATGLYRTIVTANSPSGSVSIPVTLWIAQGPVLLLSTKGAQYQSVLGGSPGNIHGSFELSLGGAASSSGPSSSWTAAVEPNAAWLSLDAGSGSGTISPSNPVTISYTMNRTLASGLTPAGPFYATIQVVDAGAANSPQSFQVVLNVAPAASLAIPDPEPGGLIFTSISGAAAPASQSVTLYSSSTSPTAYAASAATLSGGAWLTLTPSTASASISSPGLSTISVNPGTLSPGIYRGNVSYQFSAADVRTVNVTTIVEPAGANCTPQQLVPTVTALVNNFFQLVAWPTPLSVRILQDCGVAIGNAQVVATFSNGDPPLPLNLVDAPSGLYSGTWTPRSTSPQVTVTVTTTAPGFSAATVQLTGQVGANTAPLLSLGGAVHIYDPLLGGALAPGTILSIYGSNLSAQPVPNTQPSLPATLGGTSVTMGGIPAPLYYVSPTQIDAQVPFELLPGDQYEVIVETAGAFSTPGSIQVIAAAPGIAAFPNGMIIAQHADYSLVTTASPAIPGEYIVIYLAGMGLTNVPVADGAPSPSIPLASPLIAPTLTLNGVVVPSSFAGLTPTFVGLYQMNLQVPLSTPNGNVTLVVSQSGVASNSTILPVHGN